MALAQLRKSSQITIPQEIRKQLRLQEGDYVEFAFEGGKATLTPVTVTPRSDAKIKLFEVLKEIHKKTEPALEAFEGDLDEFIDEIIKEVRAQNK